ncbi:MAG: TIM barrel protein [Methanoregulaceae archaeon]|nr:TIM barrel protein [Methanoregulaceae archaeon]
MQPSRRELLTAGAAAAAGMMTPKVMSESISPSGAPFKLKYAPHFGMFRSHAGDDLVDQLKFAADEGFLAWEDNGMRGRSAQDQEKIGKAMTDLGITMGVFVANDIDWTNPTLTTGKQEQIDRFVQNCRDSVAVAKRVNAKWMTVVPGTIQPRLDIGFQTAYVVDALRRGAEIFEKEGLVMVLEPLNFRDHPNLFLNKIPQAYNVCRAVNSSACKILFDMYHQQIHEGNLIPNIDLAWSEVAYFQIGDNPGRNEPTTGEINYLNVFRHIHAKGFTGVMGMEHGNAKPGKEGERALIDAYRKCDSF